MQRRRAGKNIPSRRGRFKPFFPPLMGPVFAQIPGKNYTVFTMTPARINQLKRNQ
jgi:hypothetical protein